MKQRYPKEERQSTRSRRSSSTCPWCTVGRKMSDKNVEQRINIKFCVKIGRSANENVSPTNSGLWRINYEEIECF